jgi:spermidine/putrescine transport system ATP-binding protein/putrescine transport system ATP-binding protein
MMEANVLLEIDRISKSFGAITAVDDLTLNVAQGEFFALLGPSGCGKTTLLRMIAGFETPDRGQIRLTGADMTGVKPNRRPINLMFQSYALFPHMTVAGNIGYGLEMEGLRGPELKRRVAEALDLVQLGALAERKPHRLSGGQRQRVALARALIKRPKLLLLDEPLGALDRKLREQMQIELKRIQRETGITFIVVTHDQEEALTMADRIALLGQGRIVQLGRPRELYEAPVNRFAADFIGMMNFLPGKVVAEGFELPGLGILQASNQSNLPQGMEAVMAIRPERLRLYDAPCAAAFVGAVEGTAYLGQDLIVHLRLEATGQPLIARLPAGHDLTRDIATGQRLWCDWPGAQARLLTD